MDKSRFIARVSFLFLAIILFSAPAIAASDSKAASDAKAAPEAKKSGGKTNSVTFNFVDVELSAVAKFISEITGKNFLFDDRIKGKITIIAPSKLSADDAYNLFTSVLELKGFTVVPSGIDAYKIIPTIEAKQRGLKISTEGSLPNEEYIARLISMKYISADDALKFFQPLVSKDGHISVFGPGNLLLVVDSGLNIEKIVSLVELIDKPSLTDMPDVILLKYSNSDAVVKILNEGLGRARVRTAPNQMSNVDSAIAVSDQRLNAVILFGERSGREAMKVLIRLIDTSSPEAQGRINVFFLENADATELAKILEGMIKGLQASRPGVPGVPGQASPFESAGGITITPDKATNSIVILASPADYQNLSSILKQLDRRRKQVYVEAMIIEASIDKLIDLGTTWRASAQKNGSPVAIGGVGTVDNAALQTIVSGLAGFTLGGMGSFMNVPMTSVVNGVTTTSSLSVPGFAALFSLSEFKDTVNILSTPQILTSDNKEAEIIVGENVPMIGKRERDITTTGTVLDSIERKDVGITLRLTPQITEGDYVKMDIFQEISAVKGGDSEAILTSIGPTTTKRSTKTSVVVKDNNTVVIGGLMQEKDDVVVNMMPWLGDIPVLGYLFKQKSSSKKKTNLLIFLTPHIVKDSDTATAITARKQRDFAVDQNRYYEGELIVTFKQGVPGDKAEAVLAEKGASIIAKTGQGLSYRIRLKAKQSVEEALAVFKAVPEIESAEPVYNTKFN